MYKDPKRKETCTRTPKGRRHVQGPQQEGDMYKDPKRKETCTRNPTGRRQTHKCGLGLESPGGRESHSTVE